MSDPCSSRARAKRASARAFAAASIPSSLIDEDKTLGVTIIRKDNMIGVALGSMGINSADRDPLSSTFMRGGIEIRQYTWTYLLRKVQQCPVRFLQQHEDASTESGSSGTVEVSTSTMVAGVCFIRDERLRTTIR